MCFFSVSFSAARRASRLWGERIGVKPGTFSERVGIYKYCTVERSESDMNVCFLKLRLNRSFGKGRTTRVISRKG